ncbi:MAG: hypothetical protein WBM87_01085 [Woeseiaceae bacterium]
MLRVVLLLGFLSVTPVLAQDTKDADAEAAPESSEQAPEQAGEKAADDLDALDALDGLDEPYPVEDEDAFIPSENVAFGQSIPFPTDI